MRTYVLFSHPVDKDKIYELMTMSEEEIRNLMESVMVDVYTINYNDGEERITENFLVIKDGNHRVSAYLLMRAGMGINGDFDFASELLNIVQVRERKTLTVKEFLYFKQLLAIQSYVVSSDDLFLFSGETLNKCIEKGLIPKTVSKDIIPFYYVYVCSDQTEGCGGYLRALLSITEDEDKILCSFQAENFDTGMNFYGSDEFDTSYEGCGGDSYLFYNKTYVFKKEFKDGSLILNSDNQEINKLFNPLLIKENKEDDYFCYKRLLLDVFDSKFPDSVRFNGKPIPYGLCIFVGDFCWGAPI